MKIKTSKKGFNVKCGQYTDIKTFGFKKHIMGDRHRPVVYVHGVVPKCLKAPLLVQSPLNIISRCCTHLNTVSEAVDEGEH